ncbi:Diaminopimelate decarboxylase [Pseudoclavibacter triregionum]|nr:Diaminopimelate decarboxylase [Pseudoclavibacter triregionum]
MTLPARNPLAPDGLEPPADPNALAPHVWSRTATRDEEGQLVLGGLSAGALRERFGTPLTVLDEADARGRMAEARAAFEEAFSAIGSSCALYYAGKAFLATTVVRWVFEEGLRLDVASGGELAVALAGGMPGERIGFHGNNKSVAEIERAIEAGVGTIILDSEEERGRVARAAAERGVRQRVRIRVNSGIHATTHSFLATAHEDQKFGIPLERAEAYAAAVRAEPSLELVGLHSHIGSQIFDTSGFRAAAERLLEVHARIGEQGGQLPELNLGGGFGIAYVERERPVDLAEMARRLAEDVAAACERLGIPVPALAFEPGRALIGPAGTTLYEVGTVKPVEVAVDDAPEGAPRSAVRRYVSVDGGMSDNARPALYDAEYTVRLASRASDAEPALVRVAGKHCESGDLVVLADYLPEDVRPGDLLAVPATGAYCWSLSSNYNLLPRPAIVAVRDGEARLVIRRETIEDLLARDAGIDEADEAASAAAAPVSAPDPDRTREDSTR